MAAVNLAHLLSFNLCWLEALHGEQVQEAQQNAQKCTPKPPKPRAVSQPLDSVISRSRNLFDAHGGVEWTLQNNTMQHSAGIGSCSRQHGFASLPQRPALSLRYRKSFSVKAAAAVDLPKTYSKACYASRLDYVLHLMQNKSQNNLVMQVSPKGDLVLCRVPEAEEQTTGGLLLPNSAQSKPTSGWQALLVYS